MFASFVPGFLCYVHKHRKEELATMVILLDCSDKYILHIQYLFFIKDFGVE